MNTIISRRRFLGAAAASAVLMRGRVVQAQDAPITPDSTGGIGFPREPFEETYGKGTTSGDLLAYPNPYLDGSYLYVMY